MLFYIMPIDGDISRLVLDYNWSLIMHDILMIGIGAGIMAGVLFVWAVINSWTVQRNLKSEFGSRKKYE